MAGAAERAAEPGRAKPGHGGQDGEGAGMGGGRMGERGEGGGRSRVGAVGRGAGGIVIVWFAMWERTLI